MKKLFFLAAVMLATLCTTKAQNVQLHYDFGRDMNKALNADNGNRQRMTLTYETFSADKWGSWFYFVDLDFYSRGMQGAYTEISREFTLAKLSENLNLAAHIEYNGGFCSGRRNAWTSIFQQCALVGPAINGHNADFSKTWSAQVLYKQFFKDALDNKAYASFQLTGVWGLNFAHNALTFSGFADLWRGQKANGHGQLVFLSEPQLWYNLNTVKEGLNLSIGTEWEFSNNFVVNNYDGKTFFVNPTIALKWSF